MRFIVILCLFAIMIIIIYIYLLPLFIFMKSIIFLKVFDTKTIFFLLSFTYYLHYFHYIFLIFIIFLLVFSLFRVLFFHSLTPPTWVAPPLSTIVKGAYTYQTMYDNFNLTDLQQYSKQEGLKGKGVKKDVIRDILRYLETGEKEDESKKKKGKKGKPKGVCSSLF